MKISVVIPAYNEEKNIEKTLLSIQQLTLHPDEVILIDGGSTDRTASIAKKWGAIVISVPHRSIALARQAGIDSATGDIIAWTDADTVVPNQWLNTIVTSLSRPGVVAAYGTYKVLDGWLPYRLWINFVLPMFMHLSYLVNLHLAPGQNSAFWRKKALLVGGYPTDFQSVEDFEIMKRLARVGRIVYLPDNTVYSSGRRGNEGIRLIFREIKGLTRYFLLQKADTFSFPDYR